jgi:hypothetical protein
MVVIPDDARYVSCSQCGAVVLAIHAVYSGERDGPDLWSWPVWICDECAEEEEEEWW